MRLKTGVRGAAVVVALGVLMIGAEAAQAPAATWPVWAYPVSPVAPLSTGAVSGDGPLEHVKGSIVGYPKSQIVNLFFAADWLPNSHPAMPPVVAVGRRPDVFACAHCHQPSGLGRPENQSLAGLPADYIVQQMEDFKNDLRRSSQPLMGPQGRMIALAKATSDEEVRVSAQYFSSLKPRKWIRVVEADTVPLTRPEGWMLVEQKGGAKEPIGNRVIEVSEDYEQSELRSPTSGFVAYVPKGSLKAGEALVKSGGNGRFIACAVCHGQNLKGQQLKGVGMVPSIAGRSPSQMARQLIDYRSGARHGKNSALMRVLAPKLTDADVVAITGYLASLDPASDR